MFNSLTKTILILVTISVTTQLQDFLAETTYYRTLTECFKLHGNNLVKNEDQVLMDQNSKQKRDQMYIMLQGIYVSVLSYRGLQFSADGNQTIQKFTEFLRKAYLWVPYHNICHAVMTMLHTQTLIADLPEEKRIDNDQIKLSLLIGALFHDLSHPGFTNTSLGDYVTKNQNLIFLKQEGDTCVINDAENVKFQVLKDLFGYDNDEVMNREILEAFEFINTSMKDLITPTDQFYQTNKIAKGLNENNVNIKYIMKNMCNQAEMSHAIIAYIFLQKSQFIQQVNESYVIASIFLTNMGVANYENVQFKDDRNQVVMLVHVADIANIGVADPDLLKQTGQQVAFEFNMEGQKNDIGYLKQTKDSFGKGQVLFASNILKAHLEAEQDILNSESFYGLLLRRINQRIEQFNGEQDWDQGKYATDQQLSFGADNNTFLYKHFLI